MRKAGLETRKKKLKDKRKTFKLKPQISENLNKFKAQIHKENYTKAFPSLVAQKQ